MRLLHLSFLRCHHLGRVTPWLAALALSACAAVGPDYQGAPAVAADTFQAGRFVRAPQQAVSTPPLATWWQVLGDAPLDALIQQALRDSPSLLAAQARLRQARANLRQQQANRLPSSSATVAAVGVNSGSGASALPFNQLYIAGLDASWEADLFGGTRRTVEAASAEADAVEADLADAQVALAAEVAQAYVGLREQQQRQRLLRQSLAVDEGVLALTRQRVERGVALASELDQAVSQAEGSRASLAQLVAQLSGSLDQLALLTGQAPGALDAQLASPAPLPALPETVAVDDPAALLRRRPDVRAAERRLASHQAQIGEKQADYFPKLSLLGSIGFSANDPAHLVRGNQAVFLGVPYLQWKLFDFGRTGAAVRQAEAGRDEALARYQAAVLGALHDANTALSRFGQQREVVQYLQQQEAAAARMQDLVQQRWAVGVAGQIEVLQAQRASDEAHANTLGAQADLLRDFVALQQSLGLGWAAQHGVKGAD